MGGGRAGVRAGVRDWAIAVGAAATLVVTGVSVPHSAAAPEALGFALLACGGLALAVRRRAPVPVLAVTGLCAAGYQAAGFDVPAVAFLFAVYAAVREGHRLVAVVASVALLAALPLAALVSLHDVGEAFARARGALELAWLVAAGAAGEALRQAERRADEAERTREETARRRADEERLHIARELHDSLTHQISIIKVQAEVAVHLARRRGEEVPEALLAIQEAGREANRELRATLEALRDDDTRPPRGLDHVPELVERARATGLDTTLTVAGERRDVPAAVERTVYRIVQEALTNVARHASATSASVRIDHRPDVLALSVDDDGNAAPHTPVVPGVGLLGMRERVTALGGRLRAQPREEGGFTVHAELPVVDTGCTVRAEFPVVDTGCTVRAEFPVVDTGCTVRAELPVVDTVPTARTAPRAGDGRTTAIGAPADGTSAVGVGLLADGASAVGVGSLADGASAVGGSWPADSASAVRTGRPADSAVGADLLPGGAFASRGGPRVGDSCAVCIGGDLLPGGALASRGEPRVGDSCAVCVGADLLPGGAFASRGEPRVDDSSTARAEGRTCPRVGADALPPAPSAGNSLTSRSRRPAEQTGGSS